MGIRGKIGGVLGFAPSSRPSLHLPVPAAMQRPTRLPRFFALLAPACLGLASESASAQVTDWVVAKGVLFVQTEDNTPPSSPPSWISLAQVSTTNPGDATQVTLSGGGIVGSLNLVQDDTDWELQGVFASQAQLNAVLPSSTVYTLTLSGGTLGTLVQQAPLGAQQYPNGPYLTGDTWSDAQTYDPAAPFTFTWNDPGALVAAMGETIFELNSTTGSGGDFDQVTPGGTTSATVPAGTLTTGLSYEGQLLFVNDDEFVGPLGPGRTGHVTAVQFNVQTLAAAQVAFRNAAPNPSSFVAEAPALGKPWTATVDLTATGHLQAQVLGYSTAVNQVLPRGQRLLVSGAKLFTLPPRGGPLASWTLPLPNDPALGGVRIYTQAVHLGGIKPFVLSNAQDLTLGS